MKQLALALILMSTFVGAQQPATSSTPQETKSVLLLSDDFAKAALKAIFALRDLHGDAPDASRVKGLTEDAEIAVSTEGDKAEMHMISLYAAYQAAEVEEEQIRKREDAGENVLVGHDAWMAANSAEKAITVEMMAAQHIAVNDTRVPEFFDQTVLMLKNRNGVFFAVRP
jgi:hypothetical protein